MKEGRKERTNEWREEGTNERMEGGREERIDRIINRSVIFVHVY